MALQFHPDALDGLAPQDAERVRNKIDWLWDNRAVITHHPLKENLSGFYKRRVGKYRILYTFDPNPDEMVIRLVGLRDDIYDILL